MPGRASALAILGLAPGADSAAIEQAYRRLIKQYHPDREGGDGVRAAEIIHAYRELRGGRALVDPLQFNEDFRRRRRRSRWPLLFLLVAAGAAMAFWMRPDLLPALPDAVQAVRIPGVHVGKRRAASAMDEPLHDRAIAEAIEQARTLYRTKDEMVLATASRDCQRHFRANPSTEWLDRCAAFDNAAVGLQDRDPLRDGGSFAPLAVTGRQWGAASALSDDYLAIDGRLAQIRRQVELDMAAHDDAAAAPPPAVSDQRRLARPLPRKVRQLPWKRSPAASGRARSSPPIETI